MKVAVIGAGSTYTPELVSGLARDRELLDVHELALHDIDETRREIVGSLAQRMLERGGYEGGLLVTGELDRALDGADYVLIQIRVGGQAARLRDETIPLACGCIGQETTGAGGFAKAMRTVPVVLEIAERVRELAGPDAWIVDFTNPVGIVTQALVDRGYRAIGLCNVAITLQRSLAELLGVDPDRLELDHVGLNHLSWIAAARVDGTDRLPELIEEHGAEISTELGLPERFIHDLGAVPSYYLHYYYDFEKVLAEQNGGHHRAEEVMELERQLLEMYADPKLDTKPELLAHRGGAWYSEAAARLLASLNDGRGDVQVVDVRNGDAVAELAPDDVVEVPSRIDRDGAHPLGQPALPPASRDLVRAVKAYEHLAIRAAESGERADVKAALEAHPLVGARIGDVEPLLDALLEANRPYLPQFGSVT